MFLIMIGNETFRTRILYRVSGPIFQNGIRINCAAVFSRTIIKRILHLEFRLTHRVGLFLQKK